MRLGNPLLCQSPLYNLKLRFFVNSWDYWMSFEFKRVKSKNSFQKCLFPCVEGPINFSHSSSFYKRCDPTSVKLSKLFPLAGTKKILYIVQNLNAHSVFF